ncbi:YvcK family protein [Candidatus Parcubacteria bacterium]|nr:YvcK family protein [Candidatus Parcubacteria bacterium]
MSKKQKNIVCLGGGTGVSLVLSGFKKYPLDLTAIVTMFDSGGSSGKLRKELDILPLGDIRQCLVALSNEINLTNLFHYRFGKGTLKGHNFGNLLIAAAIGATGGLDKAMDKIGKILNIKGRVVPVTLEKADIVAVLKNNKKIKEEEKIINCPYLSKVGVKKLFLEPKVKANPKAISAIQNADLIIIAPGKFYTSILPIFLAKGISEAVRKSQAKKVFVCNLMTQVGNTDDFYVMDFLTILEKYLGKDIIDYIIFNTGKLSSNQVKEIREVFPKADFIKYNKSLLNRKNFIGVDVINRQIRKLNPADILVDGANQRTMIVHNPNKLAKILLNL